MTTMTPGMVGPFDGVDAFHERLIMVLESKGKESKNTIMEHFLSEVSKGKGVPDYVNA